MRHPAVRLLVAVVAIFVIAAACGGDDDDDGHGLYADDDTDDDTDDDSADDDSADDDSADDDSGDDDSGDDDSGDTTPPDPPFVYPPESPYPQTSMALSGIAELRSTVKVVSPVDTATIPVDENGDWCLLIGLDYDPSTPVENLLSATAIDEAENESDPLTLVVWVDRALAPQIRNVAPDSEVLSTSTHDDCGRDCGGPANAVDENLTSYWENSVSDEEGDGWFKQPQWLMIDMEKNHYISGSKVTWASAYGKVFKLYYTDRMDPPNPDESLTDWVEYGSEDDGRGDEQQFPAGNVLGRWVALLLYESNTQDPTTDAYRYQIKEFRVTGIPWDEYLPEPSCP